MIRAACVLIGFAMLTAKAEIPANINTLINKILAAAQTEPPGSRFETLLQLARALQFQLPDEAKKVALKADRQLGAHDDDRRARVYQVMLNVDASEAAKIAASIRDKNVLYRAEFQHCAEHHDAGCGEKVLAKGHKAGAYRISNTKWLMDQLAATDPSAAHRTFEGILRNFPSKTATFEDVQVLLDSAKAIASIDLPLARRAAKTLDAAVQSPAFEARSQEIVTAQFLVNGKQVASKSTRETVLMQTQSLLKQGSFPHILETNFAMKHPIAGMEQLANRGSGSNATALLQELAKRVQELNDFTLQGLNGRPYRLTALRGRPVLLDFWATWCGPCRREMPQLDDLAKKGLTILAITDEDEKVVRKFAASNPYSFSILLDRRGEVFSLYGVTPRPTIILIDSSGKIIDRWIDLPENEVLQAALTRAGFGNPN